MPRSHTRFDVVIPVRFRDADDFMVQYAESISVGGVFIGTQHPPPVGTKFRLSLELPGTQTAVPVLAQVMAIRGNGCDVSFIEMDPAAEQVLQSYVQGLRQDSRGRVVIIDDDPDIVGYLTEFLRKNRFTVIGCATPREVLQACTEQRVDVVLSDLYMPVMSGPQLRGTLLQAKPETEGIPWILMTSSDQPGHERRADEMGFYSFLHKPIDRDALVKILIEALQRKPKAPRAAPPDELKRLGITKGRIEFKFMKLCNAVTGAPIEWASVWPVSPTVVALTEPAHLANLPHIHTEGMPDQIAFEAQVVRSYHARVEWLGRGKALLARYGVPSTVSEKGFCVIGTVQVRGETIAFSVRDEQTLAIEAVNGQPFASTNNPSDALVDIAHVDSGAALLQAVAQARSPGPEGPPLAPQPETVVVEVDPNASNLFGSMDDLMHDATEPVPPEPAPMLLIEGSEIEAVEKSARGAEFDESFFETVEPPEAFSLMCSICGDPYELQTGTEDTRAYVACPDCR